MVGVIPKNVPTALYDWSTMTQLFNPEELPDEVPEPVQGKATGRILIGDAHELLRDLPDESVQTCVTSPPYWGLRDYQIEGQIGAEMSLDEYLSGLTKLFSEVRRVLSPDGTFWLNIGDSYTSGGRTWRDTDKKNRARGMDYRAP